MNAPKLTKEDLIKELDNVKKCISETSKFLEENKFTPEEILEIERVKGIISSIKIYDKIAPKVKFLEELIVKRDSINTQIDTINDSEIYSPL